MSAHRIPASANPVSLTIKVMPKAYQRLHESAAAKGYSATGYATLLFEAGFAARVDQERGKPVTDAELDEQVKLVFICAGQANTAAIARAIGIPEARVVKILDGWKRAEGGK